MTIHPLFSVYTSRPFYMFSNVLNSIKAECSIHQNVQYFIRSKTCVLNFTAVRYSLHKCRETILCYKWQFTVQVSPVFPCIGVHGSKKNLPPSSSDLILVNSLLCRVSTRLLRRWSSEAHPLTLLQGSGNCDVIKEVPDRLLKRAAMVFRVYSRHVELLLTYRCS